MEDRKYLQEDEISKLSTAWETWTAERFRMRARYHWVWLVILHTGARISEALALTDASFLHDKTSIRIPRLKLRKSANPSKNRPQFKTIRVSATAFRAILTSRIIAAGTRSGVTPSYPAFYFAFQEVAKRAGITDSLLAHPHAMRHSFAVRLLRGGMDSSQVMQVLGHSSIASTLVYLQSNSDDLGREMEARGLLRA